MLSKLFNILCPSPSPIAIHHICGHDSARYLTDATVTSKHLYCYDMSCDITLFPEFSILQFFPLVRNILEFVSRIYFNTCFREGEDSSNC